MLRLIAIGLILIGVCTSIEIKQQKFNNNFNKQHEQEQQQQKLKPENGINKIHLKSNGNVVGSGAPSTTDAGFLLFSYPYEGWLAWYWYFGPRFTPTSTSSINSANSLYMGELQTNKASLSNPFSAYNPSNNTYYFFEGNIDSQQNMHIVYLNALSHQVVQLNSLTGNIAATLWDGGRVIAVISTSVGTHIYSVSPAGLTSLLFKVPLLVRQGIATMDVENRILYFATVANPNRIAQLHLNSGKLVTFPLNVSLSSIQFGNGQLWALGAEYQGPNLSLMRVDVMSGAISNIIRISEYDPSAIVNGRVTFGTSDSTFYTILDKNLIGVNTNSMQVTVNVQIEGVSADIMEGLQWAPRL